jgi:hypothetical protein
MVAASLLRYRHAHRSLFVSVALVVLLLSVLCLLGSVVFAPDLSSGPMPDGPLVGPFRWWTATDVG